MITTFNIITNSPFTIIHIIQSYVTYEDEKAFDDHNENNHKHLDMEHKGLK
jgi:hypothetical protein